ncbi:MAG: pyruvate, phosphate dikinase, partial [Desulfarculus sp.]|nr:pyruvate, phosphate dikinase [Desulfarculus sp.]
MAPWRDIFARKTECVYLAALQGPQAERYRRFRNFLRHNQGALSAMAELEQLYYSGRPFSLACARRLYDDLLESMHGVAWSLEAMTRENSAPLVALVESLDRAIWDELNPALAFASEELVIPFPRLSAQQRGLVGSKAANLAAMKNDLGLPAPDGFAITAAAFELFLHVNDLEEFIEKEVAAISLDSPRSLEIASARIRQQVIFHSQVPASVEAQVLEAYEELEAVTRPGVRVAMRSSAIGEDTEASFAGQYSTELNVTKDGLLLAYQAVLASKYSPRALAYRLHRGLDDRETPMSVACVAMVDSLASGVMYTVDPADPAAGVLKINAIWGLGEHLVDGSASPDTFLVSRPGREIAARSISRKDTRLVNLPAGGIKEETVPDGQRDHPAIGDDLVRQLAEYGLALERHFGGPQDVEWALDQEGRLLLLQCRPLEVAEKAQEAGDLPREYPGHEVLLSGGRAASQGVAVGEVYLARGGDDLDQVPKGAILVAPTASPAYARLMGHISGLISDVGSVTSHLASVAREFGVPALVDAKGATSRLLPGQTVTLWASAGLVYQGVVEDLLKEARAVKNLMVESPVHRRLRKVLDQVSPLTLTDPQAPSFNPAGCRTLHDVVRYAHEQAMRGMFGLAKMAKTDLPTVKLTTTVPMIVQLIDVGGGLQEGLTTCDTITANHLESTPLRAIWRGISHPGINWTSTVGLSLGNMLSLMAGGAAASADQALGTASFAVISRDYLNLSARFGYHFANLDCLCGDNPDQNYFSLQFAGGAGDYRGRALRI